MLILNMLYTVLILIDKSIIMSTDCKSIVMSADRTPDTEIRTHNDTLDGIGIILKIIGDIHICTKQPCSILYFKSSN